MGWPKSGNWDRAETPPGASYADIAQIMSALCLAVNQRESQTRKAYGSSMISLPETEFYYTGNGTSGAKKARPLASDWAGKIHESEGLELLENTLNAIKTAIQGIIDTNAEAYGSCWLSASYTGALSGLAPSDLSTSNYWRWGSIGGDASLYLWAYANVGYTWNPATPLHPDNWTILRRALDAMVHVSSFYWGVNAGFSGGVYCNFTGGVSDPPSISGYSSGSFDATGLKGTGLDAHCSLFGRYYGALYGSGAYPPSIEFEPWTASADVGGETASVNPFAAPLPGTSVYFDITSVVSTAIGSGSISWEIDSGKSTVADFVIPDTAPWYATGSEINFCSAGLVTFGFQDLSGWLEDQT